MGNGRWAIGNFKNLGMGYKKINETKIYQLAFEMAMKIFEISKQFLKEERYALTDQIRRSSRSVCACLAEANRKRLYQAHFVAKISDADMENSENKPGWNLHWPVHISTWTFIQNSQIYQNRWEPCFIT